MAAPPCYGDLGKNCRDLFSKGYNYGQVKLDLKAKTKGGAEYKVNGNKDNDSGVVAGALEFKLAFPEYGLTMNDKLTTDNQYSAEFTVEDKLLEGLKTTFDMQFAPSTGKKGGQIKAAYKREYFHGNFNVDLNTLKVSSAVVIGYNGWLGGYHTAFDTQSGSITDSYVALGYAQDDFSVHSRLSKAQDFDCSVHHKVNKNLELGIDSSWKSGTKATLFGLASKYTLDQDATVKAKVNTDGQLGLGYTRSLRGGLTATVSAQIQANNIAMGGHKLGMGLEFEA